MSSAEKLKALESFTNPNHGPLPSWWPDKLATVLPQLVAVVEAAESLYDRCEELRLEYSDPAGVGMGMKDTQAALAALDEALS